MPISAQLGGPEYRGFPATLIRLRKAIERELSEDYLSEVAEIAVIFRIGGSVHDYESEAIEAFTFDPATKACSVDVLIPASAFHRVSSDSPTYLTERLMLAVQHCLDAIGVIAVSPQRQSFLDAVRRGTHFLLTHENA